MLGEACMLFLMTAKHNPEGCPLQNEKAKKATAEFTTKMEGLLKKHGIKIIGAWHSHGDHSTVAVYDAPSMEALLKFSMEPEAVIWAAYNVVETKPVMTLEESLKMFLK